MRQVITYLLIAIGVGCLPSIVGLVTNRNMHSDLPRGSTEALAALGVFSLTTACFTLWNARRWRSGENATKAKPTWLRFACAVLGGGAVAVFLAPSVGPGRESARRSYCKSHLHKIGMAMRSYHTAYGSFPPAYVADENGRPAHSWRVLLLPFMDEDATYKEYRFDEPWNGPGNSELRDRPKQRPFVCLSAWDQLKNDTNYVAVVGSESAMPGARPRQLGEFQNAGANTILIVEVLNSGIHWMEPRDLSFDEMCFGVNDPSGKGIASRHSDYPGSLSNGTVGIAHVLFADGTVRQVPENTPPREIYRLLRIDNAPPDW